MVRSGLKPGDLVIVNGLQRVRPGMQVESVPVAMDLKADPRVAGAAQNARAEQ